MCLTIHPLTLHSLAPCLQVAIDFTASNGDPDLRSHSTTLAHRGSTSTSRPHGPWATSSRTTTGNTNKPTLHSDPWAKPFIQDGTLIIEPIQCWGAYLPVPEKYGIVSKKRFKDRLIIINNEFVGHREVGFRYFNSTCNAIWHVWS